MRTESELKQSIETYSDTIKRICFLYLKNESDTEDVFQDVFLKYALFSGVFNSPEHEKAWLIRVTINRCKDVLKNFYRRNIVSINHLENIIGDEFESYSELLETVLSLPEKYKVVIYLFYYENYSVHEISKILHKNENTIYTNLSRGREKLKKLLGDDYLER